MAEKKTGGSEKEIIYVPIPEPLPEDEIDLIELWSILWAGKWFIMGFTLACALMAVYVTLYKIPVTYKADTVLLPNKIESGSSLSGLMGNLSIPINLPGKSGEIDKVMAFLNSRTLKARLIEKYKLLPRYHSDIWDSDKNRWKVKNASATPTLAKAFQEELLKDYFQVESHKKTGLITISWVDESPEFTKTMLERVIEELKFFLENEYETDAKRERRFVEKQLAKTTSELEYWENQVPSKTMTLSKIKRETLATQTVYTELRKQLELTKITEAKEVINFKILDTPFVPEYRYKPARTKICLLTIIVSGFFSVLLVFAYQFYVNAKKRKNIGTR